MKWIVQVEDLQSLPTNEMTMNNLSLLHNLPPIEGNPSTRSTELLKDQAFMTVIDQLNQTSVVSRITAFTNMGKVDKNIYRLEDNIITVDQGPKGLVIESPGNMTHTTDYFMGLLGFSKLSVSSLNCDIGENEALVLAALMDIRRRSLMTTMHGIEVEGLKLDVTKDDVLKCLVGPRNRAMVTSFVYGLVDMDISQFTEDMVASSLMNLMEKGLVAMENGIIQLSTSLAALVDALLVFNCVIRFETVYNSKEEVFIEKANILYGAPNAILFIEKSPVGIHLMSIAGAELVRMLN